jgi:hypothetical protein
MSVAGQMEDRIAAYLRKRVTDHSITAPTAALAVQMLQAVREATPQLPEPDASATCEGDVLFTWDRGEHHLELQVYDDGAGDLFYRDRETGEIEGGAFHLGSPLPDWWLTAVEGLVR